MIDIVAKACVGCSACASICPRQCIRMVSDHEGFLYPKIQMETCVQCGSCEKACPVLHRPESLDNGFEQAWGAVNKDTEILLESSSGGLFTALGQAVLDEGGCIFGAAFDSVFKAVHHIMVDNVNDLALLRGSKYIQSEMGDAYIKVREQLAKKRKVLFSGTPCQVAGLRGFIGREDDNLILVDVICHGAPSALLWQYYLEEQKKKIGENVKEVSFRNKLKGWHSYGLMITTYNNKQYYRSFQEDPFMKMFLRNYSLRESCYQCSIKEIGGVSDITIGDFWNVEKVVPEMDDFRGVSLGLVHSDKGSCLFERVRKQLVLKEVEYEKAVSGNSAFSQSVSRPKERDAFYCDLTTFRWNKMKKKYGHDPIKTVIRRKISATVFGDIWRSIIKRTHK